MPEWDEEWHFDLASRLSSPFHQSNKQLQKFPIQQGKAGAMKSIFMSFSFYIQTGFEKLRCWMRLDYTFDGEHNWQSQLNRGIEFIELWSNWIQVWAEDIWLAVDWVQSPHGHYSEAHTGHHNPQCDREWRKPQSVSRSTMEMLRMHTGRLIANDSQC